MAHHVKVKWLDSMAFEADLDNHKIIMDADAAAGGENRGPLPKPLTLASLGGCTGMDVVSLLKKMRVDFTDFEMKIVGELTDEHPKVYHTIRITYFLSGKDLPLDKIQKAVDLSREKYCGVSAMLKHSAKIEYEIVLNEESL